AIVAALFYLLSTIKWLDPFKSRYGKSILLIIFIIIFTFTNLLYIFDFYNYIYLKQRITSQIFLFLNDFETNQKFLFQQYPMFRLITLAISLICFEVYIFNKTYSIIKMKLASKMTLGFKWLTHSSFVIVIIILIFGNIGQYPLRWSSAFTLGNTNASIIALNPYQSLFSSLKFSKIPYNLNEVKQYYPIIKSDFSLQDSNDNDLNYSRYIPYNSENFIPQNIIVIICESFSYYKTNLLLKSDEVATTPFFDSLANSGILFTQCFTPHYGTARGVWNTITSIPDVLLNKTATRNPLAVNQNVLINNFDKQNYYFIGGNTSWANVRGLLKNNINNLNLYEDNMYNLPIEDVWGISDKNLLLYANNIFSKSTQPFCAIIQTSGNHRPYTIPKQDIKEGFNVLNVSNAVLKANGFENNKELNAFRLMDYALKRFFETAKKSTYFKNTLFVIVGDHGIAGQFNQLQPQAFGIGGLNAFHVPLLFYAPGNLKPQRYTFPCSQSDIMPTIAGFFKKPIKYSGFGKNILADSFLKSNPQKNNFNFIIDTEIKQIGLVNDSIYYNFSLLDPNRIQMYNIKSNYKIQPQDTLGKNFYNRTNAYFQTANYLLFHNK
ncbi:MAG: LTA synthase family protein, partial [Alphaproteobacteria bacterium]|nr:LTA synthase family protein [Alphaproteobacteria bacterium]